MTTRRVGGSAIPTRARHEEGHYGCSIHLVHGTGSSAGGYRCVRQRRERCRRGKRREGVRDRSVHRQAGGQAGVRRHHHRGAADQAVRSRRHLDYPRRGPHRRAGDGQARPGELGHRPQPEPVHHLLSRERGNRAARRELGEPGSADLPLHDPRQRVLSRQAAGERPPTDRRRLGRQLRALARHRQVRRPGARGAYVGNQAHPDGVGNRHRRPDARDQAVAAVRRHGPEFVRRLPHPGLSAGDLRLTARRQQRHWHRAVHHGRVRQRHVDHVRQEPQLLARRREVPRQPPPLRRPAGVPDDE